MNKITKYVQTVFDMAFIDAIEYLVKNKREHKKFRTAKELLNEMGIAAATYISIRLKKRGVSKALIPDCIHILTKKYGVSEEWLKYRRGEIMSIPITQEAEKAMSFDKALTKIKELEIELNHTKELLEESRKMVQLQQMIISESSK